MAAQRRQLPPLDYLVAFEAAARLGGFTAAAGELNLTQGAVSRKIRLLEHHLGRPLFLRGHRSVELTEAGRAFRLTVATALDEIAGACAGLRRRDARPRLTIAATQSVSTLWLMPRLQRLREAHPEVGIGLFSSDDDAECLASHAGLLILRGEGRWPGFESELLLDETIFPVCAAAYADRHALAVPADLARGTLIEVASRHPEWMMWDEWLDRSGLRARADTERLTFNAYALAVQAAVDGLGVALGWRHLVDRHLADGRLVRPVPGAVTTASGYHLLRPRGRPEPEAATLRRWLLTSV